MDVSADQKLNLVVAPNYEQLSRRCVDLFIQQGRKQIESKGVFYTAISGGSTPKRFFELLGQDKKLDRAFWQHVQLFWVDERYVPKTSPWSNYKLAEDAFLSNIPIPKANVYPIDTDQDDFQSSAKAYENTLREVFGLGEQDLPQFDLIFLGVGKDGHMGSLFPNNFAMFDTSDLACVVYVMDEDLNRITLTHPVISAANHIVVMASGEDKAGILRDIFTSEPDEIRFPIHTLWPVLNKITWVVDQPAAKLLQGVTR